jgi:arylsulfatase A-like enzyme
MGGHKHGKKDLIEKYKAKTPTDQKNPTYAAMVESVDDTVGKIMDTLDELDLSENTVVIFTSDNGGLIGPTSNKPLRSGEGFPYEGKAFELFNLKDDLSETNELAQKMPEKVGELDAMLTAWLKKSGAKMPGPNPDYDPNAGIAIKT